MGRWRRSGRLPIRLGEHSIYLAYVTGECLTRGVNQARNRFSLLPRHTREDGSEVGIEDIYDKVQEACRRYLEPFTSERRESAAARVEALVRGPAPQYRYIVSKYPDRIVHIDPDMDDRAIEVELAKVRGELEFEVRESANKFLENRRRLPDSDELQVLVGKITESHRADLAGYVAHRRIVLDLLELALHTNDQGKYPSEEAVHKLVFPMRADSDDITADEDHNLWLVDERLAFYHFLASDQSFKQVSGGGIQSIRRADLIALDRVASFGEGDNLDLTGVTLVEFKRAEGMETANDDPVARLLEYAELLRLGKIRRDGFQYTINNGVPIYAYAICNITEDFQRKLRNTYRADPTADGGWFLYREALHVQIHVVSYRTLLLNARKRNASFFDKAGLPTASRSGR